MLNSIKIDGVIRSRKSKALFTDSFSEIEIQCFNCGIWKEIKKIKNEHIIEKFLCGTCSRRAKLRAKRPNRKPKKIAKKKSKKFKPYWPEDCPHYAFFRCKSPRECVGCYYNPERKIAMMPKPGVELEKGEKKPWFYSSKKHAKLALEMLNDIKTGKGLHKKGNRCYFKHARKEKDE